MVWMVRELRVAACLAHASTLVLLPAGNPIEMFGEELEKAGYSRLGQETMVSRL